MNRRKFTTCLNLEPTAFNLPIGGLIGGGSLAAVLGITKGLLWAFGGGAIGFIAGGWLWRQWYLGNIQRKIYWHCFGQKIFIDGNVPESHNRKLI